MGRAERRALIMAIENFDEVKAYFDTNKDTEEIKNYIGGLNPVTTDRANAFLNTEDGKKLLQPKLDTYHNKGLESWKTNNLDTLVAAKVKELHPDADPKDLALNKLQAQLDKMQGDSARKDLTNKTLKQFQEKKLPAELVDFIIGADEDATSKNLEMLTALFAKHDEAIKTEFAKSNSYTPPNTKGNLGKEEEAARAEIAKFMGK
jgi:hypothetical protein